EHDGQTVGLGRRWVPLDTVLTTLGSTQAAPPGWLAAAAALVALIVVGYAPAWHLSRGLITIAHEGGHALVAVLARRQLKGIRLHSDTSGVTVTKGSPTGFGMIATAAAGYVAPSLVGLGAAWLTSEGRVALLLWSAVALLTCMLLLIRNFFGALTLLVVGG